MTNSNNQHHHHIITTTIIIIVIMSIFVFICNVFQEHRTGRQ